MRRVGRDAVCLRSGHGLLPCHPCTDAGKAVVGALLVAQAALLCWLEELLYAGETCMCSAQAPWPVAAQQARGRALRS